MRGRRRGHTTVTLLVMFTPLMLLVITLVSTARQFARDEREQEGADAAAAAAARSYATDANAVAALNVAAATTMADLAVAEAVCAGVAAAEAYVIPGPMTALAIARGSPVCMASGGLVAELEIALSEELSHASIVALAAPTRAESAALTAAQDRAPWREVGVAPADALPFLPSPIASLCPRAHDDLDDRIRSSVFWMARGEPGGAAGLAAFSSAAETALTSLCAQPILVYEPAAGETTLVAWVRGTEGPAPWAADLIDGELAEVAVGGVRLARNGDQDRYDQTWWAGATPLAATSAEARATAPAMPWDNLHH